MIDLRTYGDVAKTLRFIETHLFSWDLIISKNEMEADVAIILGTGLDGIFDEVYKGLHWLHYNEIPFFPDAPEFQYGYMDFLEIKGKKVIVMFGRPHYYQGYSMEEITYPIRVLRGLGVKHLILTSSVGGVSLEVKKGDLMVVADHINFFSENPFRGRSCGFDLGEVYSDRLRKLVTDAALKNSIELKNGILAYTSGPVFETPAEAKMFQKLGIDAVGWSVVPEATMARFLGMEVLAISCVTDVNYPRAEDRDKILETAEKSAEKLKILIESIIESI